MSSARDMHRWFADRARERRLRGARRKQRPQLEPLEAYTLLSFVVTNTNSTGPGSLQQAITDANNNGGGTIDFDVNGGGAQTISVGQLPAINSRVTIDGTSQPGYSGTPLITLAGPGGSGVGLTIESGAGGSSVRGLAVTGFGEGILIDNSAGNFINADVIAGNGGNGLVISGGGSTGNVVSGDEIGVNAAGDAGRNNNGYGLLINGGASNNTIGGTIPGAADVISSNTAGGILITDAGTTGNVVQGSFVGTDRSGNNALANGGNNVSIKAGASGNTIGGTAPGSRNVISGSSNDGVSIGDAGTSGNVVQGNFIGTNAAGAAAIPNGEGVNIHNGASGNTIGGTSPGSRNVISGNLDNGVDIHDPGSTGNRVQGNFIGTDASGTRGIPNQGDGVLVVNSASNNTIGGIAARAGNTIAFNLGNGVAVGQSLSESTTGVAIYNNSIFYNAQLGIDLGDNGVTPNSQANSGPNNLQNFPLLTSASSDGITTTIGGTLSGAPNAAYRLEFYANPGADPTGYGEGKTELGTAIVHTDGNGNARFTVTFRVPVSSSQVVTATASDMAGNTSEFAKDLSAAQVPAPPTPPGPVFPLPGRHRPIAHFPVRHVPVRHLPVRHVPVRHVPVRHAPIRPIGSGTAARLEARQAMLARLAEERALLQQAKERLQLEREQRLARLEARRFR